MFVERIDPAFGNWLAGFVDGEGCFYIARIATRKKGVEYVNYRCAFTIGLRDDDRAIIEEIRNTFGFGLMADVKPRGIGKSPMVYLQVLNKADVLLLVDFFDRFPLRAKKARDFAIWREAVLEWNSKLRGGGRHIGRQDWSRMAELHEELKAVRKYV
jgi:hypothetical protein